MGMMPGSEKPAAASRRSVPYGALLAIASIALIVVAILLPRVRNAPSDPASAEQSVAESVHPHGESRFRSKPARTPPTTVPRADPQEVVSAKLSQFARDRHNLLLQMARQFQVGIPADAERFFAAVEAGRWAEVTNLFAVLSERRKVSGSNDLQTLWGPIHETFGVAEVAHNWPPEKLLAYGHAVLDSLRPGMVYAGGTDAGRFIPTLLNETSDRDRHIVLTQNALADNTYLKYLNFLYSDRLALITPEESQKAFADYIADAQQRLAKDQLRPGEDVRITDGRVQVSGQVAVMAINEKIFQLIANKNPEMSFAMEESFPLKSAYSNAVPLGPILELRGPGAETPLPDVAAQAVNYWRDRAQEFTSAPEVSGDAAARQAWAKMASSQAGLLADRGAKEDAVAIFDVALDLCPSSPEVVFRYANLLLAQNRPDAALGVAERAIGAAPEDARFKDLAQQLRRWSNTPKR